MNGDARNVEVRILGLPLELQVRSQEHFDDLRRELALIAGGAATEPSRLPARLLALVDELEGQYAAVSEAVEVQLEEALHEGAETRDLVLLVPPEAEDACRRLREALEEADRFCAAGEFVLNLVTPPDLVALREWYLGEFVRQLHGEDPTSWDDWAAERG